MFIFRLIANGLAPLTLIGAILAYFMPEAFLIFGSIFKWLFAATMFALGVVLEPKELNDTLKHPKRIGLGVLTQFLLMPTMAFILVKLANLPPALALGFIIVGSAPGAMASNVIVYLAGGAMAFSIAMTTVATFLSPLITPSMVELLGGHLLPIPFWKMMQTILLTASCPSRSACYCAANSKAASTWPKRSPRPWRQSLLLLFAPMPWPPTRPALARSGCISFY